MRTRHCDSCGAPDSPPHIFTAQQIDPTGIRVTTTITVPQSATWEDVRDVSEFAQMTASRAMAQTLQARMNHFEKAPF